MDKIEVLNIFAAVFEKGVLDALLEMLDKQRTKFWGTEGTIKYVQEKAFEGESVVRGFDFSGRVKSLDRANFVRILADRENLEHMEALKREYSSSADAFDASSREVPSRRSSPQGRTITSPVIASGFDKLTINSTKQSKGGIASSSIRDDRLSEPFDLVIVDLYAPDESIFPESMDIGGQTLIRAAIKNYQNVALAYDEQSIEELVLELNKNACMTTLEFRKSTAKKAAKFIAQRTKLEAELFEKIS